MAGIFRALNAELKRGLWKDVDFRQMGKRSLPIAAAAVAGVAGLAVRKKSQPPDAQLIETTAISCKARSDLANDGFPCAAEMRRMLEEGGADIPAVVRASQTMRGPLERDLMAAEQRIAAGAGDRRGAYAELAEKWAAAGYLAEPTTKRPKWKIGLDCVTQVDESYGRDIGCHAPLCLLSEDAPEEFQCLGVEDWAGACDAVAKNGVVLLRSFLQPATVAKLRQILCVKVSALDASRKDARGFPHVREYTAEELLEDDEDLQDVLSAIGRHHYCVRGRKHEVLVRDVQAGVMPLVWEYFARAEPEAAAAGRQPYISEVQLLVSDACAVDEFWHVDNAAHGLTLFVPLTEVSEDIGPMLLLPGTHHLFDGSQGRVERLRRFSQSFLSSDGVATGTMLAGDALVYDSRTVQRGAMNCRYDRSRVALVFRYDVERPPGFGIPFTFFLSKVGMLLAGVQSVYKRLPSE